MKRKMWITIDTEMDADPHWRKKWPPEYSSVCSGIPKKLRPLWNRYHVHPIYFVSAEVLYSEECCRVLRDEIKYGAIIGAHLHPEYIEPESQWGENIEKIRPQFPNNDCTTEMEIKKIENLTQLIEKRLGVRPIWYRGARFGADLDTIHALEQLGYQYDSSVTPDIDWRSKGGPDHSKAPKKTYRIAEHDMYTEGKTNIIEYPITIRGKRWGVIGRILPDNWLFYKWLRPTHMTYLELRHMISREAKKNDGNDLVMMFHSMEIMINKTPYVRTGWMQNYYLWRLRKSIEYAQKRGYEL